MATHFDAPSDARRNEAVQFGAPRERTAEGKTVNGGDDDDDGAATMLIRVPARPGELARIRSGVRAYIEEAGGESDVADDLELVVSELATNVIEHTSSKSITVVIERTGTGWIIEVADVEDTSLLDHISLPPATSLTGRGLFVVRSLVDTLEVIETATARAVRCMRLAN